MSQPLILVVEDNLTMLEGIRDLLEMSGYRVKVAVNGQDALTFIDEERPDLIISDIMMPMVDGYQFHAKVRERADLFRVPFIFLTARGEQADIRRGKAMGVDDYITKPFDEEDLLIAVRAKLSRWGDLRRLRDEEMADLKLKILLALSHEFRTPLAYILNYTEMLEMDSGALTPEEFRQFMQGIRKGASRLNRLVEDFIKLVELETGEAVTAYRLRRHQISDTSAWLRVVGHGYQAAAERRGLKLIIDIPERLPPLLADESYLGDAIGRLLDNAIKFSKVDSKWVRLKAEADASKLKIIVEDQGVGIPEREIPSLFSVFHQVDRAKHEQQGTGSGLAICKGLLDLHGGRVTVDSEFGMGSIFTIELPLETTGKVAV
jgi:signal transduction histidine kinase